MQSKGTDQVDLDGFGLIYMKLNAKDLDTVCYKLTGFDGPRDMGTLVTKQAFFSAWARSAKPEKLP